MTSKIIIDGLMQDELARANKKHPEFFASNHEAYAVIKEEVEEAFDELHKISMKMNLLWGKVKNDESIEKVLIDIGILSYYLIAEAIQVYAMAEKGLRSNAQISRKED